MVRVVDQPIRELFGQQVAPLTSANLTTSRRSLNVRQGFTEVLLEPEVEVRVALCPKILGVFWYDASANVWHDLGDEILDSAKTGTALFTLAAADFLYIGAVRRFGGVRFDLDGSIKNNNASTMTAQYSAGGNTWAAVAITNGTDSSGTFAQDGNVTITVENMPAENVWIPSDLRKLTGLASAPKNSHAYWLRLITNNVLDQVEIEQLGSYHHDMAALLNTGGGGGIFREDTEYTIDLRDDVGAIEFINIAAASTTMNVTWIRR